MPGDERSPVLIPSYAIVGREQAVVVEFPRDLPVSGFITLAFHPEGSNEQLTTSVPIAKLGPNTLRANFPKFSKPGRIEVSVNVMREESILFPRLTFCVLSPLEAIFSALNPREWMEKKKEDGSVSEEKRLKEEERSLSLLAMLLAFLAHSSDECETDVVDCLLSRVLWSIPSSSLKDWNLGTVLSGRLDLEENLLHLCMRQRLEETAMALLQPQCVEGKAFYILQKARIDNKTPLDIARKNGMKKAVELAEMAMEKRIKMRSSSSARSVDSDVVHMPFVMAKKKEKHHGGNRLKKLFGKDKDVKLASPPLQSSGGRGRQNSTSQEESDSPATASLDSVSMFPQVTTTPRHQHHHQHYLVQVPCPLSPSTGTSAPLAPLHLDSRHTSTDPEDIPTPTSAFWNCREMDKNISGSREQLLPHPDSLPQNVWQPVASSSLAYEPVNFTQVSAKVYDIGPPPSDVAKLAMKNQRQRSSGDSGEAGGRHGGEVGEERESIYQVPNSLPIDNSLSEDEDDYMIPSSILRVDNLSDDEDIYKIPSSILRVDNLSEDEDIYKIPSSILRIDNSMEGDDIYKIPNNIPVNSDSESEDIYQVPRSVVVEQCPDKSEEDDHSYEFVPTETLSEMKLNEILFSLDKGHYMKVPSREFLLKHTVTGTKVGEAPSEVRARSELHPEERLVREAISPEESTHDASVAEKKNEVEEEENPPHFFSNLDEGKIFTSASTRITPTKAPQIESSRSASIPKGEIMYEEEVNNIVDDILVELEAAAESYHQSYTGEDASIKSTETVPCVSPTLACNIHNLNQQLARTAHSSCSQDSNRLLQTHLPLMNVELEEQEELGITGTGLSYHNINPLPLQDLKNDNLNDREEERQHLAMLSTSDPLQDSIMKQGIDSGDISSSPDITSSSDLKNHVLVPAVESACKKTEENGSYSQHNSAIKTAIFKRVPDSLHDATIMPLNGHTIPSRFICEPPPYAPPQLSALSSNTGEKTLTESRTPSHKEDCLTFNSASTTSLHHDEYISKAPMLSRNTTATSTSCSQPVSKSSPAPPIKPRKCKLDTIPSSLKPVVNPPLTKVKTLDRMSTFEMVNMEPATEQSSSHMPPNVTRHKKPMLAIPLKPIVKPPSPKPDCTSTFEIVDRPPSTEQSSFHFPPDITRCKKQPLVTPLKTMVNSSFEIVDISPNAEQSFSNIPPSLPGVILKKKPPLATPSRTLARNERTAPEDCPNQNSYFNPPIPTNLHLRDRKGLGPVPGPKPSVEEGPNGGPVPGPKPSQGPVASPKSTPSSIAYQKSSQSPAIGPKPNQGPVVCPKSTTSSVPDPKTSQSPSLGPKPNQGPIVGPKSASISIPDPKSRQSPVLGPKPYKGPAVHPKSSPSSVPDLKSSQSPALGPKPNQGPVVGPKSTLSSVPSSKPSPTRTPSSSSLPISSPIPGSMPQRAKFNGNAQGTKPLPPPVSLKTYQKKNSQHS